MQELINELLKDKEIKDFIKKNNLSNEDVIDNYSSFATKLSMDNECCKCLKNGTCTNESEYSVGVLTMQAGRVKLKLEACPFEVKGTLISYFDETIPTDVYQNNARLPVFEELSRFLVGINDKIPPKGVYIYGMFGQGKSVILYNFAKKVIAKGKKVLYAYYPDLVRRLKSSLGTNELESMLLELKKVDVLMLDDLGGENNSAFVRDEILGPILQYRMNNYLPTFATSNYTLDALMNHFAETSSEQDKLKAGRIIERIRCLMTPVELKDKDYRN